MIIDVMAIQFYQMTDADLEIWKRVGHVYRRLYSESDRSGACMMFARIDEKENRDDDIRHRAAELRYHSLSMMKEAREREAIHARLMAQVAA